MHKIFLVFVISILLNTSLWAMDLNQTTTIINEAKEATAELQDEFNTILNEMPIEDAILVEEKNDEFNTSIEPVQASEIIEINTTLVEKSTKTIELNETKQINQEQNNTEQNLTVINKIETNQTDELNGTLLIKKIPKSIPIVDINRSNLLSDMNESISVEENMSIDNNESNDNTDIQANSQQGLVIFKTKIKPYCDMTGEQFAKQYTQEDWDDMFHDKEFKMEIIKACPKIKEIYKDKWTPHLYQFSFDYASDSDAIPDC